MHAHRSERTHNQQGVRPPDFYTSPWRHRWLWGMGKQKGGIKEMRGGSRRKQRRKNKRGVVVMLIHTHTHTHPPSCSGSCCANYWVCSSLKAAAHLGWPFTFIHTHTHAQHTCRCCTPSKPSLQDPAWYFSTAGPVGDAKLTIICIGSNQHESRAAIQYDINSTGQSGAEGGWCKEDTQEGVIN